MQKKFTVISFSKQISEKASSAQQLNFPQDSEYFGESLSHFRARRQNLINFNFVLKIFQAGLIIKLPGYAVICLSALALK